jgi:hypothetical protein
MANPWSAEFSLLDRVGNVSRMQAFATGTAGTVTVTDLVNKWLATGALVDDATTSQIVAGQIIIPMTPSGGWKSEPASSGFTNVDTLVMNFKNAVNQYATPVILPAYLESFIVNGKVDLTAAELDALITDILSTAGAVDYVSRDFQVLTAIRDAFLTGRKQRGQRARSQTLG